MVALYSKEPVAGPNGAEDVEAGGQVFDGVVDEVARENGKVRMEVVGGGDDFFEDFTLGEPADVKVADVGKGESV